MLTIIWEHTLKRQPNPEKGIKTYPLELPDEGKDWETQQQQPVMDLYIINGWPRKPEVAFSEHLFFPHSEQKAHTPYRPNKSGRELLPFANSVMCRLQGSRYGVWNGGSPQLWSEPSEYLHYKAHTAAQQSDHSEAYLGGGMSCQPPHKPPSGGFPFTEGVEVHKTVMGKEEESPLLLKERFSGCFGVCFLNRVIVISYQVFQK